MKILTERQLVLTNLKPHEVQVLYCKEFQLRMNGIGKTKWVKVEDIKKIVGLNGFDYPEATFFELMQQLKIKRKTESLEAKGK